MKLVVPSEVLENEKRVGVTPDCVTSLIKMGFKVFVQSNAGINSSYSDDDYKKVIFNDIIYLGERVRDMVYLKDYNKVVMILENSPSLAILEAN